MKRFQAGLVVGKFCPLHRGHQYLIETALAQCERVIVVSYTKPDFQGYDRAKRQKWLDTLYPQAKCLVVDDAWLKDYKNAHDAALFNQVPHDGEPEDVHRRFTSWLCLNVLSEAVQAVFTSEEYGDGFARVMTAYLAENGHIAAPVTHVCVDKARTIVAISGTRVRANPAAHRAFLDDVVYASLVKRVVIFGGESTGKTTLARALAKALKTSWVGEYGRELWEQKDGQLVFDDMLHIGEVQCAREDDAILGANNFLICDTSPLTTALYSEAMFGAVDPALALLAKRAYDHIFVCTPDIDFIQDGTRQDRAFRDWQHSWYLEALSQTNEDFTLVSGTVEERVLACVAAV
jgi:HTH-type transcriptional regulator, transcriptional repressor of NAD biosynthesis genes